MKITQPTKQVELSKEAKWLIRWIGPSIKRSIYEEQTEYANVKERNIGFIVQHIVGPEYEVIERKTGFKLASMRWKPEGMQVWLMKKEVKANE